MLRANDTVISCALQCIYGYESQQKWILMGVWGVCVVRVCVCVCVWGGGGGHEHCLFQQNNSQFKNESLQKME